MPTIKATGIAIFNNIEFNFFDSMTFVFALYRSKKRISDAMVIIAIKIFSPVSLNRYSDKKSVLSLKSVSKIRLKEVGEMRLCWSMSKYRVKVKGIKRNR